MSVAHNILAQLGGGRFLAMTGARNLTSRPDGLSMHLPRTLTKCNAVRITLTAMDDYIVEGLNIRGTTVTPIAYREGVYCDTLRDVFERMTGLKTSLGSMGQ